MHVDTEVGVTINCAHGKDAGVRCGTGENLRFTSLLKASHAYKYRDMSMKKEIGYT